MQKNEYIATVNYFNEMADPIGGADPSSVIKQKARSILNDYDRSHDSAAFRLDFTPSQFAQAYITTLTPRKQKSLRGFIMQLKYIEKEEDIELFYANSFYREGKDCAAELKHILKFLKEASWFVDNGRLNMAKFIRFFAVVDRLLSRRR